MDAIIKLIPIMLKMSGNNEELCEKASFVAWRMAVGSPIINVTLPKRLIKKTLTVLVQDITWKKELEKFSSQLLFQINTILGSPIVTGFDFYVDAKEFIKPKLQSQPITKILTFDPVIVKSAQKILDDELREKFLTVSNKYLEAQKHREELKVKKENLMK